MIELDRALFPDGEDEPPILKKEDAQGWILSALSSSYFMNGQPVQSVKIGKLAIAQAEHTNNKKNNAIGLGNIGQRQISIGTLSAAERNLRRQIDLCREIVDEFVEAVGHQELGRVLSYRGAWQEAEQELDLSFNYDIKTNDYPGLSLDWAYRTLRLLLMTRDTPQSKTVNLKSSIESAQRALRLADEMTRKRHSVPRDYVRAHWLLGAAYRANTDLTLAEENLSKALDLCRQINLVEMEADILLDLARLRYAQSDFKDAQEKASEALVITERSGYVLQGADVHLFLAELAMKGHRSKVEGQLSDKEAARFHAQEALRLATCDGPPYYYKVAYEEAERMLASLS